MNLRRARNAAFLSFFFFFFLFHLAPAAPSAGLKVWRQISILRPVDFLIRAEWMRPQTNLSNPASKHGVRPIAITAGRQEEEKKGYEGERGRGRRHGFRCGLANEGSDWRGGTWTCMNVYRIVMSGSCFRNITVIPFPLAVLVKTPDGLQRVQNSALLLVPNVQHTLHTHLTRKDSNASVYLHPFHHS